MKRFSDLLKSKKMRSVLKSVWLFPGLLLLILVVLVSLKISGSSIGFYNTVFYGSQKDDALLLNKPQPIRSDEYSVNSQMAISQLNNDFKETNKNIGEGEDMTILADIPFSGWSSIFHPHNLGFLILPFDNAFSLKWWLPLFLLMISVYFFSLRILPKKRLFATLLALCFAFSPFIQWWYLSPSFSTIYYCLFGIMAFTRLFNATKLSQRIIWSLVLAYLATAFIFIFYPPFQIAAGLVMLAYLVGYLIQQRSRLKNFNTKRNILFGAAALLLALIITAVFIVQKLPVIESIQNTAYPGARVLKSGQALIPTFFSFNSSPLLQSYERSKGMGDGTNQSELSNFILVAIFLIPPALYLLYKAWKRKKYYYITISLLAVYMLMLAWLFIPGLDIIGKITLLDKVPPNRLLLGVGFINILLFILFIKLFSKSKVRFSNSAIIIYSLLIFIFYLLLDFFFVVKNPEFMGYKTAVALALPIPLIVFLFLKRYYILSVVALLLFTIGSTFFVNPLYRGTDVLQKAEISQAIKKINGEEPKRWVGDDNYLENFAMMNGAKSLTGTYLYPHLDLWKQIDKDGSENNLYNRYAHVNFAFDRDSTKEIEAYFYQPGNDLYYIITEVCDPFLKNNDVGYLITNTPFKEGETTCATLKTVVEYPKMKFYIYKLSFE